MRDKLGASLGGIQKRIGLSNKTLEAEYYASRVGLKPQPKGPGKGAHATEERIAHVRSLIKQGVTQAQARRLHGVSYTLYDKIEGDLLLEKTR